jgi:broad specificity phosphatase PhoE
MAQARALADSLKHEPVSHIFCSDLKRASRTAAAISEHHPQILVIPDQLFREQDFGELEGKSWRHTSESSSARVGASFGESKTGESKAALAERSSLAWDWVLQQLSSIHEPHFVIIVSHGLFLSSMLTTICLLYGVQRPANVSWKNTAYLRFNIVADRAPVLVLDRINESGHLATLRRQKGGVGSSKFEDSQTTINHFFDWSPRKK